MASLEIGSDGVNIDAAIVAKGLRIAPEALLEGTRAGTITSLFERGEGRDAGRVRLTFFSDTRRVRVTASDTGEILSCSAADYKRMFTPREF